MPREPRIYVENVLYFVTARVGVDKILFHDDQDYRDYIKLLSEYKSEYGFKLYAYSLMPEQLCLLIELQNNVTISTIMHNLNSRYTKNYNSRYAKKGHLFQSRFKSILIEKDDYLLRLTRHIHLLPKDSGVTEDPAGYSYSSYQAYVPKNYLQSNDVILRPKGEGSQSVGDSSLRSSSFAQNDTEFPNMADEIKEVLNHLSEAGTDRDKQKAYAGYVQSADDGETDIVRRLLHRTAFVGSREFINAMNAKIEDHIKEEEKARIVRKPNRVFVLAGSLVILFLAAVARNFYKNQSTLQNALHVTASGFEAAREDLARRVHTLQREINGFEEKENHGLGGFAWELQLAPVQQEKQNLAYKDQLQFKGGKVISEKLMARGFPPFDYTITQQTHGKMIWQTTQTNTDGTTVRWYGIIAGDKMRGVFSERPVQGTNRDFSFVSVRRLKNG